MIKENLCSQAVNSVFFCHKLSNYAQLFNTRGKNTVLCSVKYLTL